MLSNLTVKIGADIAGLQKELGKVSSQLNTFSKNVGGIATTLGIAFSAQQVISFGIEISKLAGEAQGVKTAFARLPDSIRLMERLKNATGGTVSKLDLMKRAVQASNFDISLEALPRLLEFATLRAQQTGQSVNYLVDSIITGIGRKSKLILDNLGISAVQLTEALGGASAEAASIEDVANAVGKIAEDNLKNMAGWSENASTKVQRLTASWENLKVAMGNAANGSGVFGGITRNITEALDALSGDKIQGVIGALRNSWEGVGFDEAKRAAAELAATGVQFNFTAQQIADRFGTTLQFAEQIRKALQEAQEAGQKLAANATAVDVDPITGLPTSGSKPWDGIEKQIQTIESLTESLKELEDQKNSIDITDQKRLQTIANEISLTKQLIDKIEASLIPVNTRELPQPGKIPKLSGSDFLNASGTIHQTLIGINSELTVGTDKIANWAESARISAELLADSMIDVSGIVSGALTNIADSFGRAIVGSEDFGKAIIEQMASFAQQFGAMLIATGIGAMSFKKFSGPQMVIAGAALVALGGAVKSMIANRPSLGGGGNGNGNAPGMSPSEYYGSRQNIAVEVNGRVSGDSLRLVEEKTTYRRSRLG